MNSATKRVGKVASVTFRERRRFFVAYAAIWAALPACARGVPLTTSLLESVTPVPCKTNARLARVGNVVVPELRHTFLSILCTSLPGAKSPAGTSDKARCSNVVAAM